MSNEGHINCGVPQGSILGPLLFLIYVNDFPNFLQHSTPGMFADDTYITVTGSSCGDIEPKVKSDLKAIEEWLETNRLSCNTSKTSYMTVGSRQNIIAPKVMTLNIYDKSIEKKTTRKLLGVHIDETMSWDNQISHIITKVQNGLRMLYKTRSLTNDLGTLNSVYRSLVQQYFNYCSIVWGNCSKTRADQLQKLQKRAARIITKADYSIRSCDILEELRWPTLNDRRTMQMNIMMYKVCHVAVPEYLTELFRLTSEVHNYNEAVNLTCICPNLKLTR